MQALNQSDFGCSFLAHPPTEVWSPESFDSDDRLMISEADSFSRQEVLPIQSRLDAQEEGLMVSLIRKAGQLGFCGVDAPEAYGGLGQKKSVAAAILERLSMNASFSVTYGITSGISQQGLILFGTEEQKTEFLPHLTSGEWIGAYALSEPNAGTDAFSLTCRADDRGGKWVLNGTKMWISNAQWADLFLVMAKIDGFHLAAFLVPRSAKGVSVSREEHKMGLKGSSTARLILEDAEVPLDALVHEAGKGHQVAMNALNLGRFKLGAMSLGPARLALEEAVKYAQDRRQFNKPISHFGLIRQKLARMGAAFFAAESVLYRTGGLLDRGFDASDHTAEGLRRAAEEHSVECSMVKVATTEAQAFIVDEALQVFGGYGFTEEFPIARIYRDSRISRIYEGTNEINRVFQSDRFIRRVQEERAAIPAQGETFISELAVKALRLYDKENQIKAGAVSDLLMLAFTEQTASLRAAKIGGTAESAFKVWMAEAQFRAAQAWQVLTGEFSHVPGVQNGLEDDLAEAVIHSKGILSF